MHINGLRVSIAPTSLEGVYNNILGEKKFYVAKFFFEEKKQWRNFSLKCLRVGRNIREQP